MLEMNSAPLRCTPHIGHIFSIAMIPGVHRCMANWFAVAVY